MEDFNDVDCSTPVNNIVCIWPCVLAGVFIGMLITVIALMFMRDYHAVPECTREARQYVCHDVYKFETRGYYALPVDSVAVPGKPAASR